MSQLCSELDTLFCTAPRSRGAHCLRTYQSSSDHHRARRICQLFVQELQISPAALEEKQAFALHPFVLCIGPFSLPGAQDPDVQAPLIQSRTTRRWHRHSGLCRLLFCRPSVQHFHVKVALAYHLALR